SPEPRGYARFLTPFSAAGFETWVSPSVHNFRVVYPDYSYGLPNIQQFTRDGQRLGATGQLNTIWNDDGEGLINQDWYGILFGAAAAWQPGESSIETFQNSYGAATAGLREPDSVDAMELGARRMDFIGLKFQLADEMATAYAKALSDSMSTDRKIRAGVAHDLGEMYGVNGRMQDIRNGYTL